MNTLEHNRITYRHALTQQKPRKLDTDIKRDLKPGWLIPYLLAGDTALWGRWDHWCKLKEHGALIDEPIPQIEWTGEARGPGLKMLEKCLEAVTRYGSWRGWSSWQYFDYFLDWILYALGYIKELPDEPQSCEGASMRLYQLFQLETLLLNPHDYFGDILAENCHGRQNGFFPTPMHVCEMMVRMQMGDEDTRAKTVMDPCLGTGRMLLCASNHSYRLYGQDIDRTVIKAAIVNGYLYAPWLVKPLDFLSTYESAHPDAQMIPNLTYKQPELIAV